MSVPPGNGGRSLVRDLWDLISISAARLKELTFIIGGLTFAGIVLIRAFAPGYLDLPARVERLAEAIVGTRTSLTDHIAQDNTASDFNALRREILDLKEQLTNISGLGPLPPARYADIVYMVPNPAVPGMVVTLYYIVHRRVSCPATILHRYWNLDRNTLETRFLSSSPIQTFPVTQGYELAFEEHKIPDGLAPGNYIYRPVVTCPNEREITRPAVLMQIISQEAFDRIHGKDGEEGYLPKPEEPTGEPQRGRMPGPSGPP